MSKTVAVRPPLPSEFEPWLALWDGYNAFYGRAGATALPLEISEMTWHRFFDASEPVHALVATLDGRVVGLAHYIFHRSTLAHGPSCYMQDLFTAEIARGKGVGRALIEAVYDRAAANGSPRVYWQTHETNETAKRLYDQVAKRSGFVVYANSL